MEKTLILSRFKDKNPASKQAVATQQVKSKVTKAKKRRLESMAKITREQRLAELNAEVESIQEEFSDVGLESTGKLTVTDYAKEMTNDETRLAQARNLNDRANEYMQIHGTDYTTALREVVKLSERGAVEPSVAEVERYMKDNDIEDFGQAARALTPNQPLPKRQVTVDEDAEYKRLAEERGYNLDD